MTEPNHKNRTRKGSWGGVLVLLLMLQLLVLTVGAGTGVFFLVKLNQTQERHYAIEMEAARVPLWEYRVLSVMSEGHSRVDDGAMRFTSITPNDLELSNLGAQGWELVTSYLEMETAFPNFGNDKYVSGIQSNVRPQRLVLIFRRPVVPAESERVGE